ncbi:hypothetical protein CRENBAI_005885 [Crenichthys baileyi]|uniref:Uncharacterized protein n=1 Tax=Crenichthys baileyi TaxID=28760 RepID=A0AAV9RMX7_9TELE
MSRKATSSFSGGASGGGGLIEAAISPRALYRSASMVWGIRGSGKNPSSPLASLGGCQLSPASSIGSWERAVCRLDVSVSFCAGWSGRCGRQLQLLRSNQQEHKEELETVGICQFISVLERLPGFSVPGLVLQDPPRNPEETCFVCLPLALGSFWPTPPSVAPLLTCLPTCLPACLPVHSHGPS